MLDVGCGVDVGCGISLFATRMKAPHCLSQKGFGGKRLRSYVLTCAKGGSTFAENNPTAILAIEKTEKYEIYKEVFDAYKLALKDAPYNSRFNIETQTRKINRLCRAAEID